MGDQPAVPLTGPTLDPALEAWLMAGAGEAAPADRLIVTSCAWVFLYPDRTLKLKKPVDFGFLDFTSLEKRRWALERELAFNRDSAPDIYRSVRSIVPAGGGFVLDGQGGEPVLEMRRFDETCVLSEHPSDVDGDFAEALGRTVARYHAHAPPGQAGGGSAGIRYVTGSNAGLFRELQTALGPACEPVIAATEAALATAAPVLDRRMAEGFVRRCHGDLHLGNILVEHGQAVLFDCIEFNDRLSEIDVLYDLAFLLMDLEFRGQQAAANRVLNGWLDEAARGFGEAQWVGLAALPLFQSMRAGVRAHVCAHAGEAALGRRYLEAAAAHLAPPPPVLMAVGGLSGTGKTSFARLVAPGLGAAPGAVILRTDEIRKRLWGVGPRERLPPEAYGPGASETVYAAMLDAARACLAAGRAVVLDAVFLREGERGAAKALAAEAGVPFQGVWLEAPAEVLRERVAGRTGDASDADLAVLEGQLARDPGEIAWRRCDARDLRGAAASLPPVTPAR